MRCRGSFVLAGCVASSTASSNFPMEERHRRAILVSSTRTQLDLHGISGTIGSDFLGSRVTYLNLDVHSGEGAARLEHLSGFFIKGLAGGLSSMNRCRTAAYGTAARSRIGWPGNSALPKFGRSAAGQRSRPMVGRSSRRVPATRRRRTPRRRRFIKKITDVVAEEAAKHPDKSIEVWAHG
jgi:hypothetical protein